MPWDAHTQEHGEQPPVLDIGWGVWFRLARSLLDQLHVDFCKQKPMQIYL